MFLRKVNKVSYLAFAASFAVMNIIGQPHVAFIDLKTVRKKDEQILRPAFFFSDQSVIETDDKLLVPLLPGFRERADKHQKWIQYFEG
jgi:hypothetical protein